MGEVSGVARAVTSVACQRRLQGRVGQDATSLGVCDGAAPAPPRDDEQAQPLQERGPISWPAWKRPRPQKGTPLPPRLPRARLVELGLALPHHHLRRRHLAAQRVEARLRGEGEGRAGEALAPRGVEHGGVAGSGAGSGGGKGCPVLPTCAGARRAGVHRGGARLHVVAVVVLVRWLQGQRLRLCVGKGESPWVQVWPSRRVHLSAMLNCSPLVT